MILQKKWDYSFKINKENDCKLSFIYKHNRNKDWALKVSKYQRVYIFLMT